MTIKVKHDGNVDSIRGHMAAEYAGRLLELAGYWPTGRQAGHDSDRWRHPETGAEATLDIMCQDCLDKCRIRARTGERAEVHWIGGRP